jgi:hypothetical protein
MKCLYVLCFPSCFRRKRGIQSGLCLSVRLHVCPSYCFLRFITQQINNGFKINFVRTNRHHNKTTCNAQHQDRFLQFAQIWIHLLCATWGQYLCMVFLFSLFKEYPESILELSVKLYSDLHNFQIVARKLFSFILFSFIMDMIKRTKKVYHRAYLFQNFILILLILFFLFYMYLIYLIIRTFNCLYRYVS